MLACWTGVATWLFWTVAASPPPPPWPWWRMLAASLLLLSMIAPISYCTAVVAVLDVRLAELQAKLADLEREAQQRKDAELESLRRRNAELEELLRNRPSS